MHLWFAADERCVGPDDADSNYRLAAETLLAPEPRSHPSASTACAASWAPRRARASTRSSSHGGASPRTPPGEIAALLDLIVLGIGPDGHVASLFPGAAALNAV